VIRVSRSNWL